MTNEGRTMSTAFFKVELHQDGKLAATVPYDTFDAAKKGADELEKSFPSDEVQLWSREQ